MRRALLIRCVAVFTGLCPDHRPTTSRMLDCVLGGLRTTALDRVPAVLVRVALLVAIPSSVLAQEPQWSFGVRGGALISSDTSAVIDPRGTVVFKNPSAVISIDVIRSLDCCLELFVSGSVPRMSVSASGVSTGEGKLSPESIQVGFNYRIHKSAAVNSRLRHWWYIGPFIGGFSRDWSSPITLAEASGSASGATTPTTTAFRFPGGWGIGVGGGFRYRTSERLALDVNVKWQHLPLLVGEADRVSWNPLTVTGGLIMRLF